MENQTSVTRLLRAALALSLVSVPTAAIGAQAPVSDFQEWTMLVGQGPLAGDFRLYLEAQPRFSQDWTATDRILLRPGLGYSLSKASSIWLGYAWNIAFPPSAQQEQRIWQQFLTDTRSAPTEAGFIYRARLEQRFFDGIPGVSVRFRQVFRVAYPLTSDASWSFAPSDELFLNLNSLAGSRDFGFDQNRLFLGVNHRFSSWVHLDFGYMIHYVRGTAGAADTLLQGVYTWATLSWQ